MTECWEWLIALGQCQPKYEVFLRKSAVEISGPMGFDPL
jgi:hypothetical protein